MKKTIELGDGTKFNSIKDALSYFDSIRKSTTPGDNINNDDHKKIVDVYKRYCTITGYKLVEIKGVTTVDNRVKSSGKWVTTRSFAIIALDNRTIPFSLKTALSTIAR